MKLNYKLQDRKLQGCGQPIIFMHGVFGSLDNLNMLAKDFAPHYQTIQVDMRNHGLSPWSDVMDFPSMAEDIAELCRDLQLKDVILIGHSMGGKVAMQLTQMIPDLISQIIVIDIAPVDYHDDTNTHVINALNNCITQNLTDKKEIISVMQEEGINEPTIQFLLKSFKNNHWLFNFAVIKKTYNSLRGWQRISPWLKSTLFIRGGNSPYAGEKYYAEIMQQFPYAQIETVAGAGHNVHAQKTAEVLQILHNWLDN